MVNQGVITDQLGKPVEKNSSKYWVKDNQSDQKTGLIKNSTEMWKYLFSKIQCRSRWNVQPVLFNQSNVALDTKKHFLQ